jgi:transposase
MKKFIRIGVDRGKRYFQVHALYGEEGQVITRKTKPPGDAQVLFRD